jgi:hypothetical protein
MVPSVKFDIGFDDYKGFNLHPEKLNAQTRLTFVIYSCRCTRDAKARHAKSITYGAKFELLCKTLQESVPYSRNAAIITGGPRPIMIPAKRLSLKGKMDPIGQTRSCNGGGPLAFQLQFLPVRRAGCLAAC